MDTKGNEKSDLGNGKKLNRNLNNVTGVKTTDQPQKDSDPGNQSKNPGQGDTRPPKSKTATP
jgi:hypothetical protein